MPVIRQSHLVAGAVALATQEAGVQAQGLRVGPSPVWATQCDPVSFTV